MPAKVQNFLSKSHVRLFPKYSIIMAVYHKDRAEWLNVAIDSILNQTVRSDDIIIIADGPLTSELDTVLRLYVKDKSISLVRLKKNQGLGNALNVGIDHAKNELIARMDADDIAVFNRFELQLSEFKNSPALDILGGQIAEFINDPEVIISYRNVPTTQLDIEKFARRRCPFNHPTIMYKKSTIQRIGCYDVSATRIEDYDLWLRALSQKAVCANLDLVLLKYRTTVEAMKRRKTLTSLKSHVRTRARFYAEGYISLSDLIYGIVTQAFLFISPTAIDSVIFRKVVRK